MKSAFKKVLDFFNPRKMNNIQKVFLLLLCLYIPLIETGILLIQDGTREFLYLTICLLGIWIFKD